MSSCMDAEGRIYGLPNNSNCLALFYDKDALEAAGVAVPTNWTELKDAAKKLTDSSKGRYGLGISAVPRLALRLIDASQLAIIELTDPPVYRELGILTRKGSAPLKLVSAPAAKNSGHQFDPVGGPGRQYPIVEIIGRVMNHAATLRINTVANPDIRARDGL